MVRRNRGEGKREEERDGRRDGEREEGRREDNITKVYVLSKY